MTAGPAAAGNPFAFVYNNNPAGYILGDTQHVVYRGDDGHLHELRCEQQDFPGAALEQLRVQVPQLVRVDAETGRATISPDGLRNLLKQVVPGAAGQALAERWLNYANGQFVNLGVIDGKPVLIPWKALEYLAQSVGGCPPSVRAALGVDDNADAVQVSSDLHSRFPVLPSDIFSPFTATLLLHDPVYLPSPPLGKTPGGDVVSGTFRQSLTTGLLARDPIYLAGIATGGAPGTEIPGGSDLPRSVPKLLPRDPDLAGLAAGDAPGREPPGEIPEDSDLPPPQTGTQTSEEEPDMRDIGKLVDCILHGQWGPWWEDPVFNSGWLPGFRLCLDHDCCQRLGIFLVMFFLPGPLSLAKAFLTGLVEGSVTAGVQTLTTTFSIWVAIATFVIGWKIIYTNEGSPKGLCLYFSWPQMGVPMYPQKR